MEYRDTLLLNFFTNGSDQDYRGGRSEKDFTLFARTKSDTLKPPRTLSKMKD